MVYRTALTTPIFGLRREIDRLFEDTFGNAGARAGWAPSVDVREDQKEITFEVELPGIKPEEVDITCENGVLTVRGEKQNERREGDESSRYHMVERTYGSFSRSFQLPQGVDEDKIEADFEHGILSVRIPKAALPQPRKIQIRASGSQPTVRDQVGSGGSTSKSKGGASGRSGEGEQMNEERKQPANAR